MEWNKVIYADCMNEENGLPTLEDKSIDLCLTDPPYNVDFNEKSFTQQHEQDTRKKKYYKDKHDGYYQWCELWFNEIIRICKKVIFTPGSPNLHFWHTVKKPIGMLIHYKRNSISRTSICRFHRYEPILLYGKFRHQLDFYEDVIDIPLEGKDGNFIHPHPKNIHLWDLIIRRLKPQSVIDPFLGSGTTTEVCTKLGIPWIGYEINEIYAQDINRRLKNCRKEPSQVGILSFANGEGGG